MKQARFVMEPMVVAIAEMAFDHDGIFEMVDWVRSRAPACLPEGLEVAGHPRHDMMALFPHDGTEGDRALSENELLVELAGRKCYNSFGEKAGRKTNSEYIANMQAGDVPHASVLYHAKMSFFIGGVSRRVSHELIRNYVGADRDEEGSPSQESTRYVENAGFYVIPPRYLESSALRERFEESAHQNYQQYLSAVAYELESHQAKFGEKPKGMDYKRILEAASSLLLHSIETSFIWTTNPMALAKMFRERDHEAADAEFRRFAKIWKKDVVARWPNLFPQPWMRE
jgi:thymidylate synthase (FAD)